MRSTGLRAPNRSNAFKEHQHMSTYRRQYPEGYYVYAYIRNKDSKNGKSGTPYYIGKGKKKRAWEKHRVPVPKSDDNIIILYENLDNYTARDIEIRLIRWYGRIDLGTGILQNLTHGGDGSSHYSPETREIIRKKRAAQIMKPMSDETKRKIGAANKGMKRPKQTLETIQKRIKSLIGIPCKEETKKKISNSNLGRKAYNNGEITIYRKEHPGGNWELGTLVSLTTCPHCFKSGTSAKLRGRHFDKCKSNPSNKKFILVDPFNLW